MRPASQMPTRRLGSHIEEGELGNPSSVVLPTGCNVQLHFTECYFLFALLGTQLAQGLDPGHSHFLPYI